MNNKIFTAIIIIVVTIVAIMFVVFRFTPLRWEVKLESPGFNPLTAVQRGDPSPTSSPIPKTFQFDGDTDLKTEMESVNPEVMDEDFSQLPLTTSVK